METSTARRRVFITGGTGYLGQRLIPALLARGHEVHALVRPGSENRLATGCVAVRGNALDASSFASQVAPADTFVHLVGYPIPRPGRRSSSGRWISARSRRRWPLLGKRASAI